MEGTRFLDYTTLLNDKENELITQLKKYENLERKLTVYKERETILQKEIERLNQAVRTLGEGKLTKEQI